LLNRDRYWLAGIMALVLLVAGNWWLSRTPERVPVEPAGPDRDINYALDSFSARMFDAEGRLELSVSGPKLVHHAESRRAIITRPQFLIDPDGARWSGRADSGVLLRADDQLHLIGSVTIEKPHPRGQIRIESDELHYDRQTATVRSPGPARLQQDGTELAGGTLKLWIDDERMELENDVRAIYRGAGGADDR